MPVKILLCVAKGQGVIVGEGLRCTTPHPDDATKTCGRLLVKKNRDGIFAGAFHCDRCKQTIEVTLCSPQSSKRSFRIRQREGAEHSPVIPETQQKYQPILNEVSTCAL